MNLREYIIRESLKRFYRMHDECQAIGRRLLSVDVGIEKEPDEGNPEGEFNISDVYTHIDEVTKVLERMV